MEIYLIRHGATAGTQRGCFNGRIDDPLSEQGKAALHPAQHCPSEVVVTPLQRTAQTAQILFPGVPQRVDPGLREMNFGVFEGKNEQDLAGDAVYSRWLASGCELPCPAGEQKAGFCARCCRAFAPLVTQALQQGRTELTLVLHGGVLMALMEGFARPQRDYFRWDTAPGTGFLLHTDAQGWNSTRRMDYDGPLDYTR